MFHSGVGDATKKKANWAYRVYLDWKVQRNMRALQDPTLGHIGTDIVCMSVEELTYSLTRFVMEVRDKTGQYYKSDTLYKSIVALQMNCHMYGRYVKFLDDEQFVELQNTLNNCMKFLASEGYSCPRQKADPIDIDDENTMWEKGVLGELTPKQLVDTVLYLLGTHFALRAVKEHKSLRVGECSQLVVKLDQKADCYYLQYTEDTSKTNQGGLKNCRVNKKASCAYENSANPERCIVRLYRKYMSSQPEKAPLDFYLRPLMKPKSNIWFCAQAMGINTLAKTVNSLVRKIKVQSRFTNHSCKCS